MKSLTKAAVGGLLWLTFSALAFGDTIYFTNQPNNVNNGGQFTAFLASNPSQTLYTYCVDALNDLTVSSLVGYSVNVVDLANSSDVTTDTRYGQTAPGSFTYSVLYDATAATAQERYAMAAWLVQQYIFPIGTATPSQVNTDDEIQNAVWTLLDATGAVYSTCATASSSVCTAGTNAEIAAAQTWINSLSAGALTAFESDVVIYSPTAVVGVADPARYTVGNQEMIGFIPEPAPLALLGLGLVAIGLLRPKSKA
jgi:hypothetical protein